MPGTPSHPPQAVAEPATVEARLRALFRTPPACYGPVPFYWWAGERLERGRMAWQLDRLCEMGVRRTVVSYPHRPDGSSDVGDPPLFSPEWWDYFRWFLAACRERGMTAGFQDYTLARPMLDRIGRETPDMQGGRMSCAARSVAGGSSVRLAADDGALVVGAWAYPVRGGVPAVADRVELGGLARGGVLEWSAPAGDWLVALVFARLAWFDPLHPEAGARAIEVLYAPFERECGDAFGGTLDLFFQDELDFGGGMPFWSNRLLESFAERQGYDLGPLLPALWHDLGDVTEKVRLDYADVVCARLEACYFKPVFEWHERRGTLFGHDNFGRGGIADGRSHYGDYFRAMRWYSAPGCDDPKLHGARAFKGLKVNSSIAHFYGRPRVWLEAFHSSGWGTTPAELLAAINEDFGYGATVVNLHGLYYTTRGGWWEWAPPDCHFRQPYWKHAGSLNTYLTRLCWLLSQGVRRCDVAMVYPIAAFDAAPADPAYHGIPASMGNDDIQDAESHGDDPEAAAFDLGKFLFERACDFDFIDHDSLAAAQAAGDELRAGPGRYRVLVFPGMRAVRFAMLEKALEFVRAGGVVVAFGALPRASDRAGRNDAELDRLVARIFGTTDESRDREERHTGGGSAWFVRSGPARVLEAVHSRVRRDVTADVPLHALHRELNGHHIYYLFNPSPAPVTAEIALRDADHFERWDPWTGGAAAASGRRIAFQGREACVLVSCSGSRRHPEAAPGDPRPGHIVELDGDWQTAILPTLDNRFGDFSLPPTPDPLGPQARRFRCADDVGGPDGWQQPDFDDRGWEETTYSFGPRLEVAGPLPPGSGSDLPKGAADWHWRPYAISRRWGIECDPFLTDWLSGPHGLKGAVPDEFLDFHTDEPGSVWFARAILRVPESGTHTLVTGARCAYEVWLNGTRVASQARELAPGVHAPWGIPHYACEPVVTRVTLGRGDNSLVMKLIQPAGQRTRAYFAVDPPLGAPAGVALRWFAGAAPILPSIIAPPDRRAIRFRALGPPGVREIEFVARGAARLWVDGEDAAATAVAALDGGCIRYHAVLADPVPRPAVIALRVEAPADSHAGDALPEPVGFVCGTGLMPAGDWRAHGLATYSGVVEYRKIVPHRGTGCGEAVRLDLGMVAATAEVIVNGNRAATLIAPPWSCDITRLLRPGENELVIQVANTLANHYSVGIPTPYALPHQTLSGLIGLVRLIHTPGSPCQ